MWGLRVWCGVWCVVCGAQCVVCSVCCVVCSAKHAACEVEDLELYKWVGSICQGTAGLEVRKRCVLPPASKEAEAADLLRPLPSEEDTLSNILRILIFV